MKNNTTNYWAWIKWLIIILLIGCGYVALAGGKADLDIRDGEHKRLAYIQDAISRKGYYIVRIVNTSDKTIRCVLFNEDDYYYEKTKVRQGRAGKWLRGPDSQEFDWYCE